MYDKLVVKVNNIDTIGFALYDTDKSEIKKKIPNTSGLVKKVDYTAKITETENNIPSISGLATNSALTAVENKMLDVSSSLVKKTGYNTKLLKLKRKLPIITLTNTLLLQSLISLKQMLVMKG